MQRGLCMSLYRFEHGVVTAEEQETVRMAACRMRDFHVGCLVVTHGARPVGLVTDRDVVMRVVAEGLDPETTLVGAIMTRDATTLLRTSGIAVAARTMRDLGVRRLPIVDEEGRVTGIVTADDLTSVFSNGLADVTRGIAENVESTETR